MLFGSGEEAIKFTYDDGTRSYTTTKPFEGVVHNIERRWRETESSWVRDELSRYQSDHPCEACQGYRLKPQALAVKLADTHIGAVTSPVDPRRARLVRGSPRHADKQTERDRGPDPERDPRAAEIPE